MKPLPLMTDTSPQQLEGGILTIPNAIAMSAAAMAPVLAVVLNAPAAVPAAGAALPLSFALAFVAAAFVGGSGPVHGVRGILSRLPARLVPRLPPVVAVEPGWDGGRLLALPAQHQGLGQPGG